MSSQVSSFRSCEWYGNLSKIIHWSSISPSHNTTLYCVTSLPYLTHLRRYFRIQKPACIVTCGQPIAINPSGEPLRARSQFQWRCLTLELGNGPLSFCLLCIISRLLGVSVAHFPTRVDSLVRHDEDAVVFFVVGGTCYGQTPRTRKIGIDPNWD